MVKPTGYWKNYRRPNREARRAYERQYWHENGLRHRRHGLTDEAFAELLASQDGVCAICGDGGDLVVDHDHAHCPGQYGCAECVRGLLCRTCNVRLGHFESPWMDRMQAYLER